MRNKKRQPIPAATFDDQLEDWNDSEEEYHHKRDKIALDSEDDFSNDDNQSLLDDEQVLGIDDEEDFSEDERLLSSLKSQLPVEDDEDDEDGKNLEEGDDFSSKATSWGSRKKIYYDGEEEVEDEASDDDRDKEEEAEALRIQKELYSKVNEEDYKDEFEDSFENAQKGQTLAARKGTMKSLDLSENVNKQELKMDVKDLNGVSDQAKLELLSQLYPDVMAMASQLEEIWSDIQEIQLRSPNMDMESKNPKLALSLIYATLTSMYVYMRYQLKHLRQVENHPLIPLLRKTRELLSYAPDFEEEESTLADEYMNEERGEEDESLSRMDVESEEESDNVSASEYYDFVKAQADKKKRVREQTLQEEKDFAKEASRLMADQDLIQEGEKRKATWKILTNKGLTPYRKKENRNPRVKKRKKYEKALKKLSSYKRVVADKNQLGAYQGETTGIKKNLSRSIRF